MPDTPITQAAPPPLDVARDDALMNTTRPGTIEEAEYLALLEALEAMPKEQYAEEAEYLALLEALEAMPEVCDAP